MNTPGNIENQALQYFRFRHADSPERFEQAMKIRLQVFVEEQQVPEELEYDEYDELAMHFLLLRNDQPVATGRLVDFQELCQSRPVAKIGRVAVLKEARGQKLGEAVMQDMLAFARAEGYEQAVLDAQTHALAFYEKLGFVKEGFEFEDAGIPHYAMRLIF